MSRKEEDAAVVEAAVPAAVEAAVPAAVPAAVRHRHREALPCCHSHMLMTGVE